MQHIIYMCNGLMLYSDGCRLGPTSTETAYTVVKSRKIGSA